MDNNTKQRYISTSIWTDEWFDSLSAKEKLIYFNLLTNTHTNAAGVYPLLLKQICADTGFSREDVNSAMQKFEDDGKAFYHKGYIILPKWMKHQKFTERSGLFAGAVKIIRGLPDEIKEFISNRRHYDFDVTKYIVIPVIEGEPPHERGGMVSGGSQDPPPNSPHDSDLDLDSDLDSKNSCGSSEPPSPATISDLEAVQLPNETPPDKKTGKAGNPKKPPLREREPESDQERVYKAYLQAWDRRRRQNPELTEDPADYGTKAWYGKNGSLLKPLIATHGVERIIAVINKSAGDPFVLQNGFSLGGILSGHNVNKQLNGSTGPPSGYGSSPPPSLAGKKSLGAILKSIDARGDLDEPFAEGGLT